MKSLTYAIDRGGGACRACCRSPLLPACLGILGKHVDALGVRTAFRVPFLRNWKYSRAYLNWLADRLQKTKTREEVETGFWGKLVNRVMKRPLVFAMPIAVGMILLVIPLGKLSLGGMSEKYLPPNNSVRQAQEHFDKLFPGYRTEQLTLVIQSNNHSRSPTSRWPTSAARISAISGFTTSRGTSGPAQTSPATPPLGHGTTSQRSARCGSSRTGWSTRAMPPRRSTNCAR